MKSQMAQFSQTLNTAQATITDLHGQLKETQERAKLAEDENSKYWDDIAALTNELGARAVERPIATGGGNSSSTPMQCGGSPQHNPEGESASQQDDNMIERETSEDAGDDDMYVSDNSQDVNMDENPSRNAVKVSQQYQSNVSFD